MTTTPSDGDADATARGAGETGTSSARARVNGDDDRGRETTTEEATRETGARTSVGRKRRARGGDARVATRGTLEPFKHRAREDPEVRRWSPGRAKTRAREDEGGDGGGGRLSRDARFREDAIGFDWIGLDWIGSGDAVGDSTWETRVSNARLTAVCAFRDVSRA